MSNLNQWVRRSLVGIATVSLAACVARPNLVSAHVTKGADKTEIVEVVLSARDAKIIREREIYFRIVIVDCKNPEDAENRFPIEPYIAGKRASQFNFSVEGEFLTVRGVMPERILVSFPTTCVVLQGGSYVFGKLASTPTPLIRITP